MRWQKRQKKTAPGSYEVLSRTRAKQFLYVTTTDQDEVIDDLVNGAVSYLEEALDFAIDTDEPVYQFFDSFGTDSYLPIWHRFITDDVVVEYWDGSAWTTYSSANYRLDNAGPFPRIILNDDATWPDVDAVLNAVRITFTPDTTVSFYNELRYAVMTLVASRYEMREQEWHNSSVQSTVDRFIQKFKMKG